MKNTGAVKRRREDPFSRKIEVQPRPEVVHLSGPEVIHFREEPDSGGPEARAAGSPAAFPGRYFCTVMRPGGRSGEPRCWPDCAIPSKKHVNRRWKLCRVYEEILAKNFLPPVTGAPPVELQILYAQS